MLGFCRVSCQQCTFSSKSIFLMFTFFIYLAPPCTNWCPRLADLITTEVCHVQNRRLLWCHAWKWDGEKWCALCQELWNKGNIGCHHAKVALKGCGSATWHEANGKHRFKYFPWRLNQCREMIPGKASSKWGLQRGRVHPRVTTGGKILLGRRVPHHFNAPLKRTLFPGIGR